MTQQGFKKYPSVVIEDDVWIGDYVSTNAGRTIKKGTIIAAGVVVTKDFQNMALLVAPAKLIKSRNSK